MIMPFYEAERLQDYKPASFPRRAFGIILICLVVPYYVLKICLASGSS